MSASGAGGQSWDTKPPATVTAGETGTFEIGSTELWAAGTVQYQDVQTGATITFTGHAHSLIGDSRSDATPTGGMQASGHQRYYGGITPHINVTYTLSYSAMLHASATTMMRPDAFSPRATPSRNTG